MVSNVAQAAPRGCAEGGPVGQQRRAVLVLVSLLLLLVVMILIAVGTGMVPIDPLQVVAILVRRALEASPGTAPEWLRAATPQQEAVLLTIRVPRVILGALTGAGLAVSGAAMQGLFRNPLADPGLIGVSSGAALAAVTVIVLGTTWMPGAIAILGIFTLPVAAFLGGLGTTWAVYSVSRVSGRTVVATMLLVGIAVNALAQSGVGILSFIASDSQLRSIVFWSMGSLGGASWIKVWPVLLSTTLTLVIMIGWLSRPLNVLLLGEAEAGYLGVHIDGVKRCIVALVALTVGAGVAAAGPIGFVGLVVPHLLRLWIGPDHRYLLPGSVLLGAILLIGADLIARTILAPAELPIGIVTAALGAPFFLFLLLRQRRQWSL